MTAVLLHGYHLGAPDWERVIWGDPKTGKLGRVPRALVCCLKAYPCKLFIGSGASADPETGEKEAACIRDQLTPRCLNEKLWDFDAVCREIGLDGDRKVKHWLDSNDIQLLTDAQNTRDEIRDVFSQIDDIPCAEFPSITKLVLVSSPTHISRCLRDAMQHQLDNWERYGHIQIVAVPSHTCPSADSPADVFIMEPSHRPNSTLDDANKELLSVLPLILGLGDSSKHEVAKFIKIVR